MERRPSAYCTFVVDGMLFGVEVLRVQEVLRYHQMTRVPMAPGVVRGLLNLRGQIVTAIDLRERLELAPAENGREPMNIVIRATDGAVSLLVDEIGDVLEVVEDQFERTPDTLHGILRDLVRGTYKLSDRLLLVLDLDATLNVAA